MWTKGWDRIGRRRGSGGGPTRTRYLTSSGRLMTGVLYVNESDSDQTADFASLLPLAIKPLVCTPSQRRLRLYWQPFAAIPARSRPPSSSTHPDHTATRLLHRVSSPRAVETGTSSSTTSDAKGGCSATVPSRPVARGGDQPGTGTAQESQDSPPNRLNAM